MTEVFQQNGICVSCGNPCIRQARDEVCDCCGGDGCEACDDCGYIEIIDIDLCENCAENYYNTDWIGDESDCN